jgi:hypothetical protein
MNSHTEDKKVESAHHVNDKSTAPRVENIMHKSHDNEKQHPKKNTILIWKKMYHSHKVQKNEVF